MPGFVLHAGATVLCMHGGQAQATVPNLRVRVAGQPTVQQANPWMIVGCPFNVAGGPVPCVTAQWVTAATRVRSNGIPLLMLDSQAVCAPNGTGVTIATTQIRVRAQ